MTRRLTCLFAVFLSSLLFVTLVYSALVVDNFWELKKPIPEAASYYLHSAVVGKKIFVIRFYPPTYPEMSFTYEYDPDLDMWTEHTPPPSYVVNPAVVGFEGKVYIFGGGVVQVYDPVTDSWTTKCHMSSERSNLDANVVDGKIYLIGGTVPYGPDSPNQYKPVNTTEVYDPKTNAWSVGASIPYDSGGYTSAVVNNKIYVINEQTQIYNCDSNTWSTGPPCPFPVEGACAVATSGVNAPKRIYVIGGFLDDATSLDYTRMYDPENPSWSLKAPMNTDLRDFVAAVVNDKIYVIGGTTRWLGPPTNQTSEYTPVGYGTVSNGNHQPTNEDSQDQSIIPLECLFVLGALSVATVALSIFFMRKRKQKLT
ncbi:MAG: hypothetical protein NWF03_03045 [Candidatus Bathyarchaeota archaeon]|nr:hypothetical protein [Candidatus Bathyarchaeota archaeon]